MSTLKTAWINLQDSLGKRFAWSHVKATFYNYADKKLLSTKLDEMDTAIGEKFDRSNVVQTESTATDKVPSAAYLKEIKDGLSGDISELTSSAIRTGTFSNKKHNDVINLNTPVEQNCYIIILPQYNTATTMLCNYSCVEISQGSDSFILMAVDVTTGNPSTSKTLAGKYFIVPINP